MSRELHLQNDKILSYSPSGCSSPHNHHHKININIAKPPKNSTTSQIPIQQISMNEPSERQSYHLLHEPKCDIMTYASEHTIFKNSPAKALSQQGQTTKYISIKKTSVNHQNDQYLYRLKMKIMNTYRLVTDETFSEVEKYSIEDIIVRLHRKLKAVIGEHQKKSRQNQKQIKLLQIQTMNLQTQIEAHSVDILRITSKNTKNQTIITTDRQRFTKKLQQKDTELQQLEQKLTKTQLLLQQHQKLIKSQNIKTSNLKKQLELQNAEIFQQQKKYMRAVGEEKQKVCALTLEVQSLKDSLMRKCQQINQLNQAKNKLEGGYLNEKQKFRKCDLMRHTLQIQNNELVERIQRMMTQNIKFMGMIKQKQIYTEGLQNRMKGLEETQRKIQNFKNVLDEKNQQILQQQKKIQKIIEICEQRDFQWKNIIERYDILFKELSESHEKEKQYFEEQLLICKQLWKIPQSNNNNNEQNI